MPDAPHLPLIDPTKDQPEDDNPVENQSPPAVLDEEPQIPVSTALSVIVSLPASPSSYAPIVPPIPSDSTRPSTFAPPMQSISISPYDFLATWMQSALLQPLQHLSPLPMPPWPRGWLT